jgi:transposase, IS30 family
VVMQRQYSHVSRVERGQIMFLKMWELKVSEIARRLGRDKATISRELRRNISPCATCYTDESAQIWAERRRKQASRRSRLKNGQIRNYVERKLEGKPGTVTLFPFSGSRPPRAHWVRALLLFWLGLARPAW